MRDMRNAAVGTNPRRLRGEQNRNSGRSRQVGNIALGSAQSTRTFFEDPRREGFASELVSSKRYDVLRHESAEVEDPTSR